jgi:phosphoribosyl 1,2-cyclic phosphodiesterase
MKLKVFASSSKGNCYLLESGTDILLLDAGVPFKDIQKALNFDFSHVVGCLLTHEHKDHSKAILDLIKAGIDVYSSKETFAAIEASGYRVHDKVTSIQFKVGSFWVMPFSVEHDAVNPFGYLILEAKTNERLLFVTDSFYCKYQFSKVNYIMAECNYCKDILEANIQAGFIAEQMKNRLLHSHMSLDTCKEFLMANLSSETRKIILIHLSDGNSDAARMKREIEKVTKIDTVVADSGIEIDLDLYPY